FMDEARFGQQGTTTRMWAPTGSRPTAVKQTRYEWVYLYAAVEPSTGASVALQAPSINTGTMNVFLEMLGKELGPNDHAVMIMDPAGWHKARALVVPDNITILYLPPYSPELNPVEQLWAYLRSHFLSNRAYDDYQHLLDAGGSSVATTHPGAAPHRLRLLLPHARIGAVIRMTYQTIDVNVTDGLQVVVSSDRASWQGLQVVPIPAPASMCLLMPAILAFRRRR
ncbi:MAG: IS630 family transposase, partial [Phycisphaerales bacterium]|nr:IS630 family transposase [Phycisphaerales bacterium]